MVLHPTNRAREVWGYWTAATTTSSTAIWFGWNNTRTYSTTSNTVTDFDIWGRWNDSSCRDGQRYVQQPGRIEVAESAAQRTERLARQEQARLATEAVQALATKARLEAETKARKILVENLSSEQRDTFERSGYFEVKLDDGRMFRIRKGWSHNVLRLDEQGQERESYCAHPRGQIPDYDNMLAQKLVLECAPALFFGVANRGYDRLPRARFSAFVLTATRNP